MLYKLNKVIQKRNGWKVTGEFPYDKPKVIFAVVPHTSWKDFFLGLYARSVLKVKIGFLAKDSLFKFPLGIILKEMGGVPVVRSKSTNFVQTVANMIKKSDHFWVSVAPEGTRKKVEKLRTGYYYMAKLGGIPIQFVKFDHAKKEINFGEVFYPGDDEERDLKYVEDYFRGTEGRIPELSF